MQFDIDLKSDHKDMFLEVRSIILAHAEMIETKKERITTYSDNNGGICHMRTMPYGIDIGFLKGAKMNDDSKKLTGKGKAMRVLQIRTINKNTIEHFMTQAININSIKI